MNERIKQLLEDATEVHDAWKIGTSYTVVDYKIFAESILFECIKIAVFNGDLKTASDIKKHFEVR